MKSVSIYALTRNQSGDQLQKMEHQLSGRDSFLKIRDWEIGSMRVLVNQLEAHMEEVPLLRFFYSFQIPRLGKEFDLLQIKDGQILNIELKSGAVPDHAIRRQLLQNRYYLSVLGRPILSLHLYQQCESSGASEQSRSYRGGRLGAAVPGFDAGECRL